MKAPRRAAALLLGVALVGSGCAEQLPGGPTPRVRKLTGTFTQSNSRDGSALLRVGNMKPGHNYASEVTIANTGTLPGAFYLSPSNFRAAPGPRGGTLADRLTLNVTDVSPGRRMALVYSGSLTGFGKTALGTFAPWAIRTYRFSVAVSQLPQGASAAEENSYQNSSVQVDFDWTAVAVPPLALKISVPDKQRVARNRSITVKARCDRPCTLSASATVGVKRNRRPTWLGAARSAVNAPNTTKLVIRLSRSALAAVQKAAPRRRAAKVTVTVDARDVSDLTATAKKVIKVYGSGR